MTVAPTVSTGDLELYAGVALSAEETGRVNVLLDRARRRILSDVDLDGVTFSDDDIADWKDGVCELGWLYWEAEKAEVMEILALPLSQLSLGTLFWTKSARLDTEIGLSALQRVLGRWGSRSGRKVVLEGELGYGAS